MIPRTSVSTFLQSLILIPTQIIRTSRRDSAGAKSAPGMGK